MVLKARISRRKTLGSDTVVTLPTTANTITNTFSHSSPSVCLPYSLLPNHTVNAQHLCWFWSNKNRKSLSAFCFSSSESRKTERGKKAPVPTQCSGGMLHLKCCHFSGRGENSQVANTVRAPKDLSFDSLFWQIFFKVSSTKKKGKKRKERTKKFPTGLL